MRDPIGRTVGSAAMVFLFSGLPPVAVTLPAQYAVAVNDDAPSDRSTVVFGRGLRAHAPAARIVMPSTNHTARRTIRSTMKIQSQQLSVHWGDDQPHAPISALPALMLRRLVSNVRRQDR